MFSPREWRNSGSLCPQVIFTFDVEMEWSLNALIFPETPFLHTFLGRTLVSDISVPSQSVLGAMLTMVGDVDRFVNAFNAAVWITYGAAIFGLIIMRITLPNKHRPFKVSVYHLAISLL